MTNCPVCQRDTPPVKIGGHIYCSVCGTPAPAAAQPAAVPAKRLSLDLAPRNHGQAGRPAASAQPAHATDAHDMHRRVKTSKVLDLSSHSAQSAATKIVAAPHHTPAAPPTSTTRERHQAHFIDRIERAKQIPRSSVINKFSGPRLADTPSESAPARSSAVADIKPAAVHPAQELPQSAATHHEAMTRLARPEPPAAPTAALGASWRPHLGLGAGNHRTAATVAAVVIMGGYIWLQNYPKLALQSANSQAGISASLPGYLPSSYSLKATDTSPGLVTLNFTSPSAASALKIAQQRTTWDSSSLLDNYVAKATDDYATVQGQGLTIFLFNDNQASWVNHGIWYSIEGASRLSREQILKIAYSL